MPISIIVAGLKLEPSLAATRRLAEDAGIDVLDNRGGASYRWWRGFCARNSAAK